MKSISKDIKHLGKNSIFFGLGYFMPMMVNVILLPVYVRYISAWDYGVLSLLTAFGAVLTFVMELCVNRAIERFYIEYEGDERKRFLFSAVLTVFLFALSVGALLTAFAPWLTGIFFKTNTAQYSGYVVLQIWISFFLVFPRAVSAIYLIKEKSSYYAILRLAEFLILMTATVLFLIVFKKGLVGILEAALLSSGLMSVFYFALMAPELKPGFDLSYVKRFLRYSLPIMPYRTFLLLIAYTDRFYINSFFSLAQVGIYAAGSRLGMVMEVLVGSFAIAWQPFYYNRTKAENSGTVFGKIATAWVGVVVFVGLAISIFSKEALILFTAPEYYSVYKIIPVLVVGHIFLALYFFSLSSILYAQHTKITPLFSGAACLFNICALFLIKGSLGIMGPAVSKAAAYFLMWVIVQYFARQVAHIKYEHKKLALIIATGLAVFFLGFWVDTRNMVLDIAIKASLLGAYLFLLDRMDLIRLSRVLEVLFTGSVKEDAGSIEDIAESN